MGITIADSIETVSSSAKLNALLAVTLNTRNGSTKINSDSVDRGINMLTKTIIESITYG